jgi:hypothetical protein
MDLRSLLSTFSALIPWTHLDVTEAHYLTLLVFALAGILLGTVSRFSVMAYNAIHLCDERKAGPVGRVIPVFMV